MRRWLTIILAIVVVGMLAMGVTSLLGVPVTSDIAPEEDAEPELVELSSGQELWTYYSSERYTFQQSSAINVVFLNATTGDVISLLGDDADWFEVESDEEDAGTDAFSLAEFDPGELDQPLGWGQAVGTERFAYTIVNGESHWLEESAQLADGDYYGTRDHLRLYELPGEQPSVAIQAHAEHFDWFTLRHTVTSIEEAQSAVEQDVMNLAGPEVITREFHGNTAVYDSDGWVTVVAAIIPLLVVFAAGRREVEETPGAELVQQYRRRIGARHLLMAGVMIGLILGVRILGVGLERGTDLGVYTIAGVLFPFVGLGPPVAAYLLGRTFDRRMDAAMSASIGLGAAIILDYLFLGVTVLPIETLLHRGGLVVAVGLIAVGGTAQEQSREYAKRFLLAGATLWVALVGLSLLAII